MFRLPGNRHRGSLAYVAAVSADGSSTPTKNYYECYAYRQPEGRLGRHGALHIVVYHKPAIGNTTDAESVRILQGSIAVEYESKVVIPGIHCDLIQRV